MAKRSILLIDGSKASRAIICKSIRANLENIQLTDFDTAIAALVYCQTHSLDLIITAMSLPDMQAQDFAEKLRTDYNNLSTPIIMMSGDFMLNIKNKTATHHINGYFDKSRGNDHLIKYIQSYLCMRMWNKAKSCHVLYVEDSQTVTRVVTNILETHNYTFQHVTNAADALTLLADQSTSKTFDILLTDIQLDGIMNGDDLIREIRFGLGLMPKDLPILVSSSPSLDRMGSVGNIFAAGANDIIEKPLIETQLIARIGNLIQ
ncbi:MAG: response regulator [Gammaproteobacteria bacterium]|nr:response regulator [Gammaproteobacteria bacterium]